jgi:hypothetical protein
VRENSGGDAASVGAARESSMAARVWGVRGLVVRRRII